MTKPPVHLTKPPERLTTFSARLTKPPVHVTTLSVRLTAHSERLTAHLERLTERLNYQRSLFPTDGAVRTPGGEILIFDSESGTCGGVSLGDEQLPRVGEVAPADGPDLCGIERQDCRRVTVEGDELDFVGQPVWDSLLSLIKQVLLSF